MKMYLNGCKEVGKTAEWRAITNPATKEEIGKLPLAEAGTGKTILDIATEGFKKWSLVSLPDRADILMKYATLLEERMEEVARTECADMGKVIQECRGELETAIAVTKAYVEKAKHLQGRVISENHRGLEKDIIFTRHEPLGVIMCIVPFNYPVELYTHKVIAALVMGNSVIVKLPSENPMPLLQITEYLIEAGVPQEALQLVYADRSFVTEELVRSSLIQGISLTGSTRAGIEVMKNSTECLHRLFFELGGNDPLIVLKDADLDYAADEIVGTRTANTGQICCAPKRFLVHEDVQDELVGKIVDRLKKIKRGDVADDTTQIGCIVSKKAADTIMEQIALTVKQGAIVVYGNEIHDDTFVEPTVLTGVTKEMDIAKDMEVFGPVIPIISFRNEEEAICIANQSCYGLEASIITKDMEKSLNMASKIQAGSVVVNGAGAYRHMDMPFGGYKMSGLGRESVSTTLEEFSQEKNYVIKHVL